MEVAVYPDLPLVLLLDLLHQLLHSAHLWMELWLWVDPLPVQVDSSQRVSVVATDHAVWVHARYQDEGVELSQELGLSAVRRYEVVDASEHLAAW